MSDDNLILSARPSWWNYALHIVLFLLIIPLFVLLVMYAQTRWICYTSLIVPLIPLCVAAWKHASAKFSLYTDRVAFQTGILSTQRKTVPCGDVRVIDVRQSLFQRIVGIGSVQIGSAGTGGYEIEAKGLPDPNGIKDKIVKQKNEADDD